MIDVVGGVYRENCMHPFWRETYGSAGRAAAALAANGTPVRLHAYMDTDTLELMQERAALAQQFDVHATQVADAISFDYVHCLAVPRIRGVPADLHPPIQVGAESVIRYGMLEGDAVVDAAYAVFDPQNAGAPKSFSENGSKAQHLALILNLGEARALSGLKGRTAEECAAALAVQERAEVVVIKMGPRGALVWAEGQISEVSAYRTERVWKIGSGDCFVAYFSEAWMHRKLSAVEAAMIASKATAYYCETQGFANHAQLAAFDRTEIRPAATYLAGKAPLIYLAGPFFNLQQRWMIEQARDNLRDVGLRVFSPFHDIGLGSAEDVVQKDLDGIKAADAVFAIADGLDAGTLYEIGYARALGKPVVVYSESESEEDLKMMSGSDCIVQDDYATAVYRMMWEAVSA
jgi:nucleoside 2-deoxyribosyltransferase